MPVTGRLRIRAGGERNEAVRYADAVEAALTRQNSQVDYISHNKLVY